MAESSTVAGQPYAILGRIGTARIPDGVVTGLIRMGFVTLERTEVEEVASLTRELSPDLALVSVGPAGDAAMDAVRRCSRLKAGLLVVLVPPSSEPGVSIECLKLGADLCYSWDEDPKFLLTSIHAAIRRREATRGGVQTRAQGTTVEAGDIVVDMARHQVFKRGEVVPLAPMEFRILALLAEQPDTVSSAAEIARNIYPERRAPLMASEMIKTYVRRIRQKIEDDPDRPSYLRNARGFGYFFTDRGSEEDDGAAARQGQETGSR